MAEQLIPINIVIADRSYRLKIDKNDEEVVRKTMKLINEKIVEYKTNFAGKDMQDYVSMVLLWFATEQQKPTVAESSTLDAKEKLQRLEEMVNKALTAC
jgi:cell division protein ZapA (FtsZ GTPase activity inhibitor)